VLSIHQTDIIIYGTDLANYIITEFDGWSISPNWTPPPPDRTPPPMVPFWSDFLSPEDIHHVPWLTDPRLRQPRHQGPG
jgi:hypothetical protein